MIPDEGAVMICWACGGLAVYQHDGSLRHPTLEERAEMYADPHVQGILQAIATSRTVGEALTKIRALPHEEEG